MLNGNQEQLLRAKANAVKEATGKEKEKLEKELKDMHKAYDKNMKDHGQKSRDIGYF